MTYNYIWSINRTLSGATPPGQSRVGKYDNEGLFRIPHSFILTGMSPSDSLEKPHLRTRDAVDKFYSSSLEG